MDTPYIETQTLLHVLKGDTEEARHLLTTLSATELLTLRRHTNTLDNLISDEMYNREYGD